jgi:negative regulator of flagellin synthesis FlgM
MKISGEQVGRILGVELRAKEKARSEKAAGSGDKVSLSQKAGDLQAARAALASTPDVRETKVAELRQQIADGSYHVESQDLATDLLRSGAVRGPLE